MRAEGDACLRAENSKRLHEKPDTQKKNGWNANDVKKETKHNQRAYANTRKEDNVTA